MTIPGHRTLHATALAMACAVGAVSVSRSDDSCINYASRSVEQDDPKANNTNSPHRYTPHSTTIVCGVIPYNGYEGWVGSDTTTWNCVDGAKVYDIKEDYTSSRAAEAERIMRLEARDTARKPWRIKQTELVDNAMVVELTESAWVITEGNTSIKWVVIWVHYASLSLIYGPDREHVMDFYRTHYKETAKQ